MNLRVLITLTILTITSGCATTEQFIEPLCYSERPILEPITVDEQLSIRAISADLLRRISVNDLKLKGRIALMEAMTDAHNEQFEAECW